MSVFVWKPEYSVSVSLLDKQHKKLFALAQVLQDAMSAGKGREVLGRCLDELVSYTKTHFSEEESLLQRYGYAGLQAHQAQHVKLIRQITELQERFASGNSFLTVEVMDVLRDWIATHILKVDQDYSDFFNREGVY